MKIFWISLTLSTFLVLAVESVDPDVRSHCPQYVAETQTLLCDCKLPRESTLTPDLSLSWPGYSNSNTLTVNNVQRQDSGKQFRCELRRNGTVTTAVYTLQVAYGPSNITTRITGPTSFPADESKVTMRCEATEVNPAPTYTWIGVACDNGNQGTTCNFTAKFPGDNGKIVSCKAENPIATTTQATAWATFTLGLIVTTQTITTPTTSPTTSTASTTISTTASPTTLTLRPVTTTGPVTSRVTTSPASSATTAGQATSQASVTTKTPSSPTGPAITVSPTGTTGPGSTSASGSAGTTGSADTTGSAGTTGSSGTTGSTQTEVPKDGSTTEKTTKEKDEGAPVGIIAGCIAGALVLIMIICVIIVRARKRKQAQVTLTSVENKDKWSHAYVNQGYHTIDSMERNNQSAASKPPYSSLPPPATGPTKTPNNDVSKKPEIDTATGFGYAPLVDDTNQSTASSTEAKSDGSEELDDVRFDIYTDVNGVDSPASSKRVTEVEMTPSASGDEYAVVHKERTAESSLDDIAPEAQPDVYAVVNKNKSSDGDSDFSPTDFSPQNDEGQVRETVGHDSDLYAVVDRSYRGSN